MSLRPPSPVEFSSVLIVQFLNIEIVLEEILFIFILLIFWKPIKCSEKNDVCVTFVHFHKILGGL